MALSAASLSLLLLLPTAASATAPAPRRNVLMLAVDDLRAEFGESYGSPEVLTPHIDRLAASAVIFTRNFCQAATCGISRSSLLTGRRPDTTRVLENGGCPFATAPEHRAWISLPRHFRNEGFVTSGAGKIFHPGVCNGAADGEDRGAWSRPYYHVPAPWATLPGHAKACRCSETECAVGGTNCSCGNGSFLDGDCDGGPVHKRSQSIFSNATATLSDMPDGLVESYAIETIRGFAHDYETNDADVNRSKFFLAVGLHKPHLPHIAPKRFFDLYDETIISLPDSPSIPTSFPKEMWFACNEALSYPDWHKDACGTAGGGYSNESCPKFGIDKPMAAELTRRHRLAYFASLSYTDELVGNIVNALDTTSLVKDTVVILWADHGWALGENNEWGKHTAFMHSNHVPLLVRLPPGTHSAGTRISSFSENVDIFPTISELAGITVPPPCATISDSVSLPLCTEGRSLAPLIVGAVAEVRNSTPLLGTQHDRGINRTTEPAVVKRAAFWQWTKMMIEKLPVMGYAMATDDEGSYYRYTEWVWYNFSRSGKNSGAGCETCMDWTHNYGTELYNLTADPGESVNIAGTSMVKTGLQARLSKQLRAGWRAA